MPECMQPLFFSRIMYFCTVGVWDKPAGWVQTRATLDVSAPLTWTCPDTRRQAGRRLHYLMKDANVNVSLVSLSVSPMTRAGFFIIMSFNRVSLFTWQGLPRECCQHLLYILRKRRRGLLNFSFFFLPVSFAHKKCLCCQTSGLIPVVCLFRCRQIPLWRPKTGFISFVCSEKQEFRGGTH